jgi:signal transduction histidine kinase/ActR/RegA family two-component response regulator/HPt (histidine-containing phosphotransfer) domain-containing protein
MDGVFTMFVGISITSLIQQAVYAVYNPVPHHPQMASVQHDRAISGKVIVIVASACVAIVFATAITRSTFRRIHATVAELAAPDARTAVINGLFGTVAGISHLPTDRNMPLAAYRQHKLAMQELAAGLDTLKGLCADDDRQLLRIDSMKELIKKRIVFYYQYTQLRRRLLQNDTLLTDVADMDDQIARAKRWLDSGKVVTTRNLKVTIDTIAGNEKDRSTFWDRLFARKKTVAKVVRRQEEEKWQVHVDTIATGMNADSLAIINARIARTETERKQQRDFLRRHRYNIVATDSLFVSHLLRILKDIEADECQRTEDQRHYAGHIIDDSLRDTGYLLAGFMLCSGVLLIMIFRDIWQRKKYKQQLIAARYEAEEAGKAKQRFLANMSHELRTPLQAIVGISEQMAQEETPQKADAAQIYNSSLHLLQVVNEVLDYSRITYGKLVLESKPFMVRHITNDVVSIMQVPAARKGLAIEYNYQATTDVCMGDDFRLRQVLLNLMGNAVKFTERGTVSLTVTSAPQQNGQHLFEFTVSDTGPGIQAEERTKIFEAFEQGKNPDTLQGTGLGLNIVREIVALHGGSIEVHSQPGKGASFVVQIPYGQGTAGSASVAPAVAPQPAKHVWIVDDDTLILQLCSRILTKYDVPHTCFTNAAEVIAAAVPADLQAILLDIRMKETNGVALAAQLRARTDVADTAVFVAFTAQAMPEEQAALLQQGFQKLLMKPFLEKDILEVLGIATSTPPPAFAAPDVSVIVHMAGGKAEAATVLRAYIAETEEDLKTIAHAIATQDGPGLANVLHRLASRVAQLGLQQCAHNLSNIETNLRNGLSFTNAAQATEAQYPIIKAANAHLQQWCNAHTVAT